ncbi:L,D-transpeptidase family protein [Bdellovibrio reynosensis]|uniref:L,D-transpeptidase family protein n=1 Tax=Bdellovibrio reynosensis TaxID=2835041 RepID=A0ABY4CCR9_9BACT|nr:L,D-transpeptidase family protein [Bdellovibrio reynosensis]UOF02700.1 L,D-transpeptidase family protein [Bdellovibrio reynosensis]
MNSSWIRKTFGLCLGVCLLIPNMAFSFGEPETIREKLTAQTFVPLIKGSNDFILHSDRLNSLYSLRGYQPIWVDSTGRPTNKVVDLKLALMQAPRNGLLAADYWDATVEAQLQKVTQDPNHWLTFELVLSESLIRYVSHLAHGRFNPKDIEEENRIFFKQKAFDLWADLNTRVSDDKPLSTTLDFFAPQVQRYKDLVSILGFLTELRRTHGEWDQLVSPGVAVKKGYKGDFVGQLRDRFNLIGYKVTADGPNRNQVDDELDQVLRNFQKLNGLKVDGIIGTRSEVLKNLNFTLSQRIGQVLVTMEKIRWLPRNMEARHIFINLAAAEFRLFDNGTKVFDFKAIAGQTWRRTPTMRNSLYEVVLNPPWNVPDSIAWKDKLPEIKRDINYIYKNNLVVYNNDNQQVNPESVPWHSLSRDYFPYRLAQRPGYNNALGVVKFSLDNDQAIYLHDTNDRQLVLGDQRHQSSGCVRLEKPLELAEYLLAGTEWTKERIHVEVPHEKETSSRPTRYIKLSKQAAIPTYLMYLTVERSEDGFIRFFDDTYGQDVQTGKAVQNKKVDNEMF